MIKLLLARWLVSLASDSLRASNPPVAHGMSSRGVTASVEARRSLMGPSTSVRPGLKPVRSRSDCSEAAELGRGVGGLVGRKHCV